MRVVTLAFEVQDGVDDVLERLRSGEASVLGDVSDQEDRHVLPLGGEQQLRGRFAHLADAAGRRLKLQREDRLNRVHDDERRLDAGDLLEYALEARLRQQVQRRAADAKPLATRFDLMLRLFAGAVQHRADRPRHVGRRLQQQRRLADARLAAQQHQRTRDDAAAQHAVEFVDGGGEPRVLLDLDIRVQPGDSGRPGGRIPMSAGRSPTVLGGPLFDERVPGAAVGAATEPLRRLRTALLADEDGLLGLRHGCQTRPNSIIIRIAARCGSRPGTRSPREWCRWWRPSRARRCGLRPVRR